MGYFLIGRSCENEEVLPAVERGVVGIALVRRLVGATPPLEERDKRVEFPRDVIVGVRLLPKVMCDDYYLASDMFQCRVMSDPHDR